MSRRTIATVLGALAAIGAVALSAFLALAPLVPKRVVTVTGGTGTVHVSSASLLEVAGWPVLAALVVVVAVGAAPLLWRTRTAYLVAAGTAAIFALVTWSTVGPYLLPLPALLLAAGLVQARDTPGPEPAVEAVTGP